MTPLRRPPPDRDVDAELEFHFDQTIDTLVDQGWSPPQARAEAERRFGDRHRYQRDLVQIGRANVRKRRRTLMWDSMRQNV
jgi:hypothetical protein